ncbi:MAG TPA: hypothetical protein PLQ57_12865 [Saprospiraceae bacterium]|nr:hypothetical protein [Saprospiraceae bacterium]HRG66071.1 hypothetical protein [Saprospiraceae bacterium]
MFTFICKSESHLVARIDVYHKMTTSIQLSLHGTALPYPQGIRCHQIELGKGKDLFNKILCIAIQVHATKPDDVHCQAILTLNDGCREERHALISGQMEKDKPWVSNLFMLIFKKNRGT